ncbi:carbon-nitrogen hydrolase family protein [Haloferax mediterranei ATCC 33500]|uniref:Hydrolase n=1 Tax=Haloferax mediterranei (strain ATCC 33500 / DSM 1411 / JCM 8866 / NBRC 14739 / NCIMB 2177 / R-4) TaxID=523841 RepID=I3R3C7_HALMT|nr:carbon-nitrogen hydrolase family protein [Haloferax mediterranei]AFK18737.1 hydrolase-like protein [Haloferax mediterranei ATCC 33500]AHZ21896.1 hydrolase [Haloferax mediterranei ATCC 33500]EMA03404.1 hydrolase-like protein [Haloferax mediterranei ATCC 33500]MDX5988832.1 carbon-nitrogen hydrolase family protein [Haloferax mediterranei ATCC 33500]QCQ75234.1 carbon-nitrogen hydrolase family protein [Haloferax mediterranei ATCC 33500]
MIGPTVAVPQLSVSDLDAEQNEKTIRERAANLPDNVDIALFPEYALTGFVADNRAFSGAVSRGHATDFLASVAADNEFDVLAGYLEQDGESLYNAAAYVRPDGSTSVYRKRHLWGDESAVVTPGDDFVIVDTEAGKTGLLTCYDLNFVADSAALTDERVDALFVVGAWPAAHSQNWRLLCRARALDGVRWLVGANRTGTGTLPGSDQTEYAGRSLVVRPDGAVAAALNRDERDLVWTLDRGMLEEQRQFVGSVE